MAQYVAGRFSLIGDTKGSCSNEMKLNTISHESAFNTIVENKNEQKNIY